MAVMSDSNLAYTEAVEANLRTDGYVQFQRNGVNSKVLIDQGRYDRMMALMDDALVEMIGASMRDIDEGRVRLAEDAIEDLRKKYGL